MAAVISVAPVEEIRDGPRELVEFRERAYACLTVRRDALFGLGYTPTLAVADGLYGYWPEAHFDRAERGLATGACGSVWEKTPPNMAT